MAGIWIQCVGTQKKNLHRITFKFEHIQNLTACLSKTKVQSSSLITIYVQKFNQSCKCSIFKPFVQQNRITLLKRLTLSQCLNLTLLHNVQWHRVRNVTMEYRVCMCVCVFKLQPAWSGSLLLDNNQTISTYRCIDRTVLTYLHVRLECLNT